MSDIISLLSIESIDQYPLVYIPNSIKNYINNNLDNNVEDKFIVEKYHLFNQDKAPLLPPFPSKTKYVYQRSKIKDLEQIKSNSIISGICIVIIIIWFIIFFSITDRMLIWPYIIFTGVIIYPAFHMLFWALPKLINLLFTEKGNLNKQVQIERSEEEYKKELSYYNRQRLSYDLYFKKKSELKSQIQLHRNEFLKNKYYERIKSSRNCNRTKNETKKGKSEYNFLALLTNTFKNNEIMIDIELGNYYPDFVYLSKDYGFCIDIEIDEQVEMETQKPIHFINSDDKRNEYFLSMNWFIVRFTEFQILNNPTTCISFLIDVIKKIEDPQNHIMKDYNKIKENRWSYEDIILKRIN